jgi:hypothetical protein
VVFLWIRRIKDIPFFSFALEFKNIFLHPPAIPALQWFAKACPTLPFHTSEIQVSLVIRGRYVPSFWTANLEFADNKSILTGKVSF